MQHCSKSDENELILSTSTGDLRGKCDYTEVFEDSKNKGSGVYSWLSIPYAELVNELRFKKPSHKNSGLNKSVGDFLRHI